MTVRMQVAERRRRLGEGEQGVALITVLMIMVVISTLAIGAVQYVMGGLSLSRYDQDWNAALAAAQAGVDDYVVRLNQDGNYWQTNPSSNGAFTGWVAIPGPTNPGRFRYSVDTSTVLVDGTLKLTSSGKVGKTVRTIVSTIRRRNFLDFLYFTDYETLDPAAYTGSPYTTSQAQTYCAKYRYAGRSSSCTEISFFGDSNRADVINGPLHANDSILVNGSPQFKGPASTSWDDPAGKRWVDADGSSSTKPSFVSSGDPALKALLAMPPSNTATKTFTDTPYNGCLFTGPTKITFTSDGRMSVLSPLTKVTSSVCSAVVNKTSPVSVSIPSDGVVYVQNQPASGSGDPNAGTCSTYPANVKPSVTGDVTSYSCGKGDVFVSGVVKGQVTLAAANSIIVTGNLTYNTAPPAGTDLIGLAANQYVEVYHPVDSEGDNISVPGGAPTTIQAAIVSVLHSFRVQNYSAGASVGTLNVMGAIAQKYRGPVGTFSGSTSTSGYIKSYVYDQRLQYVSPPHFLDPVASAWLVKTFAEVRAAY